MELIQNIDFPVASHAVQIMKRLQEHLQQKQLCDVTIIGKYE